MKSVLAAAAIGTLVFADAFEPDTSDREPGACPPPGLTSFTAEQRETVDLINSERAQLGMDPVQVDWRLVFEADLHGLYMALFYERDKRLLRAENPGLLDSAYHGHLQFLDCPEPDTLKGCRVLGPRDRLRRQGMIGNENIWAAAPVDGSGTFSTAELAHAAFVESGPHYSAMTREHHEFVGVAYAPRENLGGRVIAVQEFGRLR